MCELLAWVSGAKLTWFRCKKGIADGYSVVTTLGHESGYRDHHHTCSFGSAWIEKGGVTLQGLGWTPKATVPAKHACSGKEVGQGQVGDCKKRDFSVWSELLRLSAYPESTEALDQGHWSLYWAGCHDSTSGLRGSGLGVQMC
jgi:hypothetical protein